VLAPLALQYADYAVWQRGRLGEGGSAAHLDYWRARLGGAPLAELPADRTRPPAMTFRGRAQPLALPAALAEDLRTVSRAGGVTLFATALAGFLILLHRHTGEDDLVVGTVTAGRKRPELEGLLGYFLNPVALRVDLGGDPTVRTLLQRVHAATLEALDHDDVPFEQVVSAVRAPRDPGRHPLFSVQFAMEPPMPRIPDGWELSQLDVDVGTSKFDLYVELDDRPAGLIGRMTYRTDLFEPATIARLARQYRAVLEAIVADPDRRVSALPLLDAAERETILVRWNATARPYPGDARVEALFARQVERAPAAVAVVSGTTSLTYADLAARARAFADRLVRLGVGPGDLVAVAMDRSPEVIVAFLAALGAGAAYLPLDPRDPPDRLAFMLADAGARLVVTDRAPLEALAGAGVPVLALNGDGGEPAAALPPPARRLPDGVLYVMYTSGSTGRPKGVVVPHRGIARLVFGQDFVRFGPDETWLQVTALTFDVSALEIWGALLHGGRLVLYPGRVPTARGLEEVIARHGVTTAWLTGSVFNAVVDEDATSLGPLRQLLVGGEALSVPHVARAAAALPATRLVNGYGPTECSVLACCHPIPRPVDAAASSIPIGPPLANTEAYVLDRYGEPVPPGVPGELHLGGPGLALGYLGRPELTAERFIPHPFRPDARLYRTGDLVRWRPGGTLDYLGRVDAQVKIRGVRIEPGEVEAALLRHPGIKEVAVVAREDGGDRRLVAYVVPRRGAAPEPEALRDLARRALPASMVPSAVVALDALPLTASGKLDRRALPAPEAARAARERLHEPPRGPLETTLARLWEDLLGVEAVGATDNFFALGGHSLLAARMVQQLADLTGVDLPLPALYTHPTPRTLAELLRGPDLSRFRSPALTLNRDGAGAALVVLHGVLTGGGFYCLALARRLGPEHPLHVVHPCDGEAAPLPETIEAMAEAHLPALRRLQPHGPYRFFGYCNGGLVAYELARRLRAAGEEVPLVAVIGPPPVARFTAAAALAAAIGPRLGASRQACLEPIARARSLAYALSLLPPRRRAAFALGKALHRGAAAPVLPEWMHRREPMTDAVVRLMERYYRVIMRYFPRPYPGRVVVLVPRDEPLRATADRTQGWGRLAASVDVHEVPGDHHTVVREHADVIADRLRPYLR
jgi:aspartate racemase